jgi:hypothetical protein
MSQLGDVADYIDVLGKKMVTEYWKSPLESRLANEKVMKTSQRKI